MSLEFSYINLKGKKPTKLDLLHYLPLRYSVFSLLTFLGPIDPKCPKALQLCPRPPIALEKVC